jgi:hypothetical protein
MTTTSLRRAIGAGAAVVLAAGLSTLGTPAATADRVEVEFECVGHWVPKHRRAYTITITAPATAARGATVTLGASIESASAPAGIGTLDTPSNAVMPIRLDGAASGEVLAQGFIYPDGSTDHAGGRASATLPNAGTVTFRPRSWFIPGYNCTAVEPIPVVATTQVR